MKNTITIYEKIPFKYIVAICLFLIGFNIWDFFKYLRSDYVEEAANFLSLAIGLTLIIGIIVSKYKKQEKIGISLLGSALIINWLSDVKILSIFFTFPLSLIIEVSAISCFWNSYKNIQTKVEANVKRFFLIVLIFLLLLILPALFFWAMGSLSNLLR